MHLFSSISYREFLSPFRVSTYVRVRVCASRESSLTQHTSPEKRGVEVEARRSERTDIRLFGDAQIFERGK